MDDGGRVKIFQSILMMRSTHEISGTSYIWYDQIHKFNWSFEAYGGQSSSIQWLSRVHQSFPDSAQLEFELISAS